jgi:hypothetical protein
MKYSRLAREKEEEIGGFLNCGVFNSLLLLCLRTQRVFMYVCMRAEEKVNKIETLRKANRESERERRGVCSLTYTHYVYVTENIR